MRVKRSLEIGQRVYEVFIYKVRPAVVSSARTVRLDDPARTRVTVYEIECDDKSASPRYYESDIGIALFNDPEEAEKKCRENRQFKSSLGPRGTYIINDAETRLLARLGQLLKSGKRRFRRARPRRFAGVAVDKKAAEDGI